MHITSFIVDVRPTLLDPAATAIGALPGVEVHARTPKGQLVVTMETESDDQTSQTFAHIGQVAGVMNMALVYHQFEAEPEHEA